MAEPIPDLQELVRNWKYWPTPLCYVRVLDAKRLLERIKELEAENARLREAFDRHTRGEIALHYGWSETEQRCGYWATQEKRNVNSVGPYPTPLEAVLAAMEQTQEIKS